MNHTAIYTRVSTDRQEIEQQLAACRSFCEYRHLNIAKEYSDVMSGTKAARPGYQQMIADIRAGRIDALVVFRLDRLGRSSRELIMLVDELETRGIAVFSLNENLDTTTPIGKAVRDILLILAQLERDQIALATKHRLQALKKLGKRLGRKEMIIDTSKFSELIERGASIRQIAKALHVSVGKAAKLKKDVQMTGGKKEPEHPPQKVQGVQEARIVEQEEGKNV